MRNRKSQAKKIKNNRRWLISALSLALTLMMTVGLCGTQLLKNLEIPSTNANAASSSAVLHVSLEWDKSTVSLDNAGVAAATDGRKVVIKVTGDSTKSVSVTYTTFDISARADKGEYNSFYNTVTIQGGSSYSFTVFPGGAKDYRNNMSGSVENGAKFYDDMITSLNGTLYSRKFGIKIVDCSENAVVDNGTVFAYVQAKDSLKVISNTQTPNYDTMADPDCMGYTYEGMGGTTEEWIHKDTFTVTKDDQSRYFDFHPGGVGLSQYNDLRSYLSSVSPYFAGRCNITDNAIIKVGGFTVTVYDDSGTEVFRNGRSVQDYNYNGEDLIWFENTSLYNDTYKENNGIVTDKLVTFAPQRGDYKKWIKSDGGQYTLRLKTLTTYYIKQFYNVKFITTLADNTKATVVGYNLFSGKPDRSSDGKTYGYRDGDNIYLGVKFSKPLQVKSATNGSIGFRLEARVTGQGACGKTIDFLYDSGNFTDTLIFKANLNAITSSGGRSDIYGSQLELLGIKGTGGATVVQDFTLNTLGQNNDVDFSLTGEKTLQCNIDTRLPKIGSVTQTTGAQKVHSVKFSVDDSTMSLEGDISYLWTAESNANNLPYEGWSTYDFHLGAGNEITGSGLNGNYYLHIKLRGVTGMQTVKTYGPFLFDNKPPDLELVTEETFSQYDREHKLVLRAKDPDGLSYVKSIYLYVYYGNGTPWILNRLVYQEDGYEGETLPMVKVETEIPPTTVPDPANPPPKEYDITYEMTLTHGEGLGGLGLPDNSFGAYEVGFVAEDALGNRNSSVTYFTKPLMYDNRDSFATEIKDSDGTGELIADAKLDTMSIYYNETNGIPLTATILETGEGGGQGDTYFLSTVRLDGETIFNNSLIADGVSGWLNNLSYADFGFLEMPATETVVADGRGRMKAIVKFANTANGMYEIIFENNAEKPSAISSFYVSSRDAETVNYKKIYNEERLLINKVWQFSATNFYTLKDRTAISYAYDQNAGVAAKKAPIFSSYEKALEFAIFCEHQDIEILHLTTNTPDIIQFLNAGGNAEYAMAEEERADGKKAAPNQTWLRYKSKSWTQRNNSGSLTSSWVYYHYFDSIVDKINPNTLIGTNLYKAMKDNAEEIANKNGSWVYLSEDNNGLNEYGEPSYSQGALYPRDIVYPKSESIFTEDISFTGDKEIYSSFINNPVANTGTDRVPLIANYGFIAENSFQSAYYRAYVAGENPNGWKKFKNGETLREAMEGSGLYEIAEIGGGYKTYLIYCDFDAPVISYYAERNGVDVSNEISVKSDGASINVSTLTLKFFVDKEHHLSSYAVELDDFAYVEIRKKSANYESFYDILTIKELNALSDGYSDFSAEGGGTYVLYIYDRLGNRVTTSVSMNKGAIITQQPLVVPNTSVTFYINRNKNEIKKFVVYRNGIPYDVEYAKEITFKESGKYRLEIEDIYGNVSDTCQADFQRDPPEARFYYQNAERDWVELIIPKEEPDGSGGAGKPNAPTTAEASLEKVVDKELGTTSYIISTSTDIRISFDVHAKYIYEVTPTGQVNYKEYSSSSTCTLTMPIDGEPWNVKLMHKNDTEKYIFITCVRDVEAPSITATVSAPEYLYNEAQGYHNVLYTQKPLPTQLPPLPSGTKVNGESVKFTWTDDSNVVYASYTLNGGAPVVLDHTKGEYTADKKGQYVVTVKDILGNTAVYTLNLSSELDFSVKSGERDLEIDGGAIVGTGEDATYSKTALSGQDLKITLREDMTLMFAYHNVNKQSGVLPVSEGIGALEHPVIYNISYAKGVLQGARLDETGGESSSTQAVAKSFSLQDTPNGVLFNDLFVMNFAYKQVTVGEGKEQTKVWELTLSVSEPLVEYEFWQFRFMSTDNLSPNILQVERSNAKPCLDLVDVDNGSVIQTVPDAFTGINVPLTLTGDLKGISVQVFYSEQYTEDFKNVTPTELYENGVMGSIESAGFYKLVIRNSYFNEQVILVRIGYGLSLDLQIFYDALEARTFTLTQIGEYDFYSNKSFDIKVWDEKATVTQTKNGNAITPTLSLKNGFLQLEILEIGDYVVTVVDECQNKFVLSLEIVAVKSLSYNDYLTGFNEKAMRREDNYTNAPLSLSKKALDADGIEYVAVKNAEETKWTVLYDVISAVKQNYTVAGFTKCVGTGNGVFEVMFTDVYGNMNITNVYISDIPQIEVFRQTQSGSKEQALELSKVLDQGAWCNFVVRIHNVAQIYRLQIDGKDELFDMDGNIKRELPPAQGEGSIDHTVYFVDEYGNEYSFAIHLFRKLPEISQTIDGELINSDGTTYIKGNISYAWTDDRIFAYYVKDGEAETPYGVGEKINEDGVYLITFEDLAGNVYIERITRDTTVSYRLLISSEEVSTGIALSGSIRLYAQGEQIVMKEVLRNGELIEHTDLTFKTSGNYNVTLMDKIGNEEVVSFCVFNDPMQTFTYVADGRYVISQVWYKVDGNKLSYSSEIVINENNRQEFTFNAEGNYEIDLWDAYNGKYYTFKVTIDNLAPEVVLLGARDGEITRSNVTLEGLKTSDTVEIYRNGELYVKAVMGNTVTSPEINEEGKYVVVIRDVAGNETRFAFEREFTTNAATNIMICLMMVLVSVGGVFFLRGRERVRTK